MAPSSVPRGERAAGARPAVSIRPLEEEDLTEADLIHRSAFAAQLGLPEVFGDTDFIRPRFRADPEAGLAAVLDGRLVGSVLLSRFGSFGVLGPISVRPELWDRGIGGRLVGTALDMFEEWGVRQTGLLTFVDSAKHRSFYRRFGYCSQLPTWLVAKSVKQSRAPDGWFRLSDMSPEGGRRLAIASLALTGSVLEGLDMRREIEAVRSQGWGDTLVLEDEDGLGALAVCHIGPGTEGGSGKCYLKFGAVRPGNGAASLLEQLLCACEALAAARGAGLLLLSVNEASREAYHMVATGGFRRQVQSLAMQRPAAPGYARSGVFAFHGWR